MMQTAQLPTAEAQQAGEQQRQPLQGQAVAWTGYLLVAAAGVAAMMMMGASYDTGR